MVQPAEDPSHSTAEESPRAAHRSGPRFGRRAVIIAAVALPVLALLSLLTWASATSGPARGGLAVNDRIVELNVDREAAPDFSLELLDGGTVTSAGLQGQVVMLDFWASWCPPCREEAPALARVYGEYQDRGVEFVGINLWDNAGDAEVFLNQQGHQYPNGVDEGGRIAISYGVRGIPEKFFINREGLIVRKFSGPTDDALLREILEALLAE